MDIYKSAWEYFIKTESVRRWPELLESFERMAAKKPRGWALPATACEAV